MLFRSGEIIKTQAKTAYEMCVGDWSSDVCSSDLASGAPLTTFSKPKIGICSLRKNVCAASLCKRRPGRCCLDTERVEFLRHFNGLCGKLGQRI